MGYVQADIKMDFSFDLIDYSSLTQTFNLPIPTPPPLPPPFTLLAPATADNRRANNNSLTNSEMNNSNSDGSHRGEHNEDGKQEEAKILNENNQENQNQQNSLLLSANSDAVVKAVESPTTSDIVVTMREVLEEAINFNFDVVERSDDDNDDSANMSTDSQPIDKVDIMEVEELPNENFDRLPTEVSARAIQFQVLAEILTVKRKERKKTPKVSDEPKRFVMQFYF